MAYNPEKHRRRSIRLPSWDYSWSWWYCVTIVARDRQCLFGKVINDTVLLNDVGKIVVEEWLKAPSIRLNVELDDYVIMPSHLHGILVIGETIGATHKNIDHSPTVGAHSCAPLRRTPHSLGSIIAGFKSAATKRINVIRDTPGVPVWQRNYYDHIIRNEADLIRIRTYIANNPLQWALDEENPDNVSVHGQGESSGK